MFKEFIGFALFRLLSGIGDAKHAHLKDLHVHQHLGRWTVSIVQYKTGSSKEGSYLVDWKGQESEDQQQLTWLDWLIHPMQLETSPPNTTLAHVVSYKMVIALFQLVLFIQVRISGHHLYTVLCLKYGTSSTGDCLPVDGRSALRSDGPRRFIGE